MSRHYNQDYFKVSGSAVEDRDAASKSKARLSHQQAVLREERSPDGKRGLARKPGGRSRAQAPARTAAPVAHLRAVPPTSREGHQPPRPAESRRPVVVLKTVPSSRPLRGKKRRSAVRRHEADVVEELRTHPAESPQEAGYSVRHSAAPRMSGSGRTDTTAGALPDALPPTGAIGFLRQAFRDGRSLLLRQAAEAVHRLAEFLLNATVGSNIGPEESRTKP